jgi:hypothetical protein
MSSEVARSQSLVTFDVQALQRYTHEPSPTASTFSDDLYKKKQEDVRFCVDKKVNINKHKFEKYAPINKIQIKIVL